MILGQRIRLNPNNVQRTFLERSAGTARFVFNWGLARWKELYAAGGKPSWVGLNRELNAIKGIEFPWMAEVSSWVSIRALADLGDAFTNFFRRVKAGNRKPGYPKFKKKGRCREGFHVPGRDIQFDGCKVKIPKLGWVRTRQEIRFPGKVVSAHFSKSADHWYVSVQVEVADSWVYPNACKTHAAVGVDLGVRDLAVLSTGERIEAPRSLRRHELKQRRLNKELARRKIVRGANWQKTKAKLARLHERIRNIRRNVTHELTAQLVRDFRWIGVEDLNVAGMLKNPYLAKSVADAAMAKVRQQLAYKAPLAGSTVVVADPWFPSSKLCSACGVEAESLPLSVRVWSCDACGTVHGRDLNAAINLKNLAAAHAEIASCPGSAGASLATRVKLPRGEEAGIHAVS